jgi:DNA-binding MarR family transcriptional regulator
VPDKRQPARPPAGPAPCKRPPSKTGSPEHAPLELERFLPYQLSIVSNTVSQAIADDYQRRFDLGVTEWRVMAVLARFDGLSAREVAERTAMDKVAVSRALARLVEAGRVDRSIHDGDKRRSVLSLSEAGWAIHDQVAPMARQRERELLAKLDAEEQAWLGRILDRLMPGDREDSR